MRSRLRHFGIPITFLRRASVLPAIAGLLAALLASSQIASAGVPQLINLQGVLKNSGQPVSNGSHSISFAIYDALTGGSQLWTETQSVTTNGGHFAVLLGSVTPLPNAVFQGTDRYLGITIPPDPELSPRQRLVSVGFSYRVSTVDGASGGTIDGSVHLGPGDTLFTSNVSSNSPLRLQTAGTTRMYLDDLGRVGIGTTTPAAKLDVFGNGSPSASFRSTADASNFRSWINLVTTNPEFWWELSNQDPSGNGTQNGLAFRERSGSGLSVERVYFAQGGGVGIGTTTLTYPLEVVGHVHATGCFISDLGCFTSSDKRYKKNVIPLSDVLTKLEHVRGVKFEWNNQFNSSGRNVTGKQIGVIAQEVESEFPELVNTGPDGNKAVDYGKLSAVLLEAIKEQQEEIKGLKEAMAKMRDERR